MATSLRLLVIGLGALCQGIIGILSIMHNVGSIGNLSGLLWGLSRMESSDKVGLGLHVDMTSRFMH